ncbi:hypothetical protein [Succinimonas sp.]|uniref:hypothetical protein n=1 Tax=Succinimonas sp. TaxID=1936151 RepID=UPI00387001F9
MSIGLEFPLPCSGNADSRTGNTLNRAPEIFRELQELNRFVQTGWSKLYGQLRYAVFLKLQGGELAARWRISCMPLFIVKAEDFTGHADAEADSGSAELHVRRKGSPEVAYGV